MKIIINQKKVDRYKKIGKYTATAGFVVLLGGFVISISQIITTFRAGEQASIDPNMLTLSYIAMFVGLILTQISLYFTTRWGRKETIDQAISNGLKGLDDRFTLFHYTAPVPHLLVGPAGVWVITSMHQAGRVRFNGKRFQQSGVSFFQKVFGQEGIGRPDLDAEAYLGDMEKFFKKKGEGQDLPVPQAVIVFHHPKVELTVDPEENPPPFPTMHVSKFKDFIRRKFKEQNLPLEKVNAVLEVLPKAEDF